MSTKIQKRRDTAANWASVNPILAQGEEGLELDTGKEKVGYGAWNSLPYKTLGLVPGAIGAETAGAAALAVAAHVAEADPHPGYTTAQEVSTAIAGKVDSTDARLSDPRTPTAHKASHATGGTDALTAADIGAATAAQGAKADTAVQPAGLTKTAVGLENVDNTSDANKPISTATAAALAGKADLDGTGKVPSAQLPGFVDDVLEFANVAEFPATGETGKLYISLATNRQYRWSGSIYVEINSSPGSTDAVPEGSVNLYFTAGRGEVAAASWWAGSEAKTKLDGIASGAEVNVNADWNASSGDAQILNKPTLGSAAAAATTDFAPAAQGVTNGNSHNHDGGDGAQIAYNTLSGLPTIFALSDATPQAPGTAAAGTSSSASRADHVHALPAVVSSSTAGLVPATGGGTINFLRADGTFAAPPGGSPGGSSGQLQWNSSGSFAGLSTSSIDGSGNLTFSGRWIQSINGAASAPSMALSGTWFSGGTSTTTKPQFLLEPAGTTSTGWNTSGTGLGVNAPSGFSGDLLDLQVNGTTRCKITSSGFLRFNTGGTFDQPIAIGGAWIRNDGVVNANIYTCQGGTDGQQFLLQPGQIKLGSTCRIEWSTGNAINTNADLALHRDAANILAQRNGTNAQAYRLYNTYTSATNFERLNFRWASNEAILDVEAGSGGGTLRGLKIGSASNSMLGFYGATAVTQPAAVADATDAASAITQLNALLSRLRSTGLIST